MDGLSAPPSTPSGDLRLSQAAQVGSCFLIFLSFIIIVIVIINISSSKFIYFLKFF